MDVALFFHVNLNACFRASERTQPFEFLLALCRKYRQSASTVKVSHVFVHLVEFALNSLGFLRSSVHACAFQFLIEFFQEDNEFIRIPAKCPQFIFRYILTLIQKSPIYVKCYIGMATFCIHITKLLFFFNTLVCCT